MVKGILALPWPFASVLIPSSKIAEKRGILETMLVVSGSRLRLGLCVAKIIAAKSAIPEQLG
jgi:hypothetical protein